MPGVAVLTRVSAGFWIGDRPSRLSVFDVTVPLLAVAVFVSEPASRSAWVIVSEAVQVIEAPGARVAVAGQVAVAWSSATVNGPVSVTLPVLVTR